MTPNYRIGTGISEITDRTLGLQMQGFADDRQTSQGVESALFSRAFIVEDPQARTRVVIVSADIWAATGLIKQAVMSRLQALFGTLYTSDNVLISGTHTHSTPGGYTGYILYDLTGGGLELHTCECIVSGMVASIQKAHNNLAPGRIYVHKGDIEDCGRNRSLGAYLNNPKSELDKYANRNTDKEMLLLKFTKVDDGGNERPVGALSWFAIHPTDRGQQNRLVCGDSKGYASALFESGMNTNPAAAETFVAAFANANAGDVSGNVEFGRIPNGIHDASHMQKHGRLQYEKARQLFDTASEVLSGSIDYRYTHVDMSCVVLEENPGQRTWPAALGLSFAAGSTEDSVPQPPTLLREGITTKNIQETEKWMLDIAAWAGKLKENIPFGTDFGQDVIDGHSPKPILFAVGKREGLVPKILPLQILKIGQLVLVEFPAEITTMAGRRLRETILAELQDIGVRHLAMAAYANEYSQYVTTKEEYDMQHYEGASNLFGPCTLLAYQQEFRKLAIALKTGKQVGTGPTPPGSFSPPAKQWRFKNLSGNRMELEFYNTNDGLRFRTLPNGTQRLAPNSETVFPERAFTGPLLPTVGVATIVFNGKQEKNVAVGQLVTITENGGIEISNT